jgi:hypothetical protein
MMKSLPIRCAVTAALTVRAVLAAETPAVPQIDQARQFRNATSPLDLPAPRAAVGEWPETDGTTSDFGTQLIFKRQDPPQPFSAFAEIGAFVTNNVALVDAGAESDGFLVASAGASHTRRLTHELSFDTGTQASSYRYDKFPDLDFQSVDLSAGLAWTPAVLRGAELQLRYLFTHLTTAEPVREFFHNHAILLGLHKGVALSRTQAIYFGAAGQWSWADPAPAGRDEYTSYAGYRAQITRRLDADLFYRYGRHIYRADHGRRDHNHTASVTLRYSPEEWLSISASGFFGANRSNRRGLDYDAGNAGAGLQLSLRF